jgi:hypothetical protein
MLAGLNGGDTPMASSQSQPMSGMQTFQELFKIIPEGDYLIEGTSTWRV